VVTVRITLCTKQRRLQNSWYFCVSCSYLETRAGVEPKTWREECEYGEDWEESYGSATLAHAPLAFSASDHVSFSVFGNSNDPLSPSGQKATVLQSVNSTTS